MIIATPDRNDPNGMEELEYEYHRLLSIAEAYTGAEKLKQSLPGPLPEKVQKLKQWIARERELREAHLAPYTLIDFERKIMDSADKDDWQTGGEFKSFKEYEYERLQREGKSDKGSD